MKENKITVLNSLSIQFDPCEPCEPLVLSKKCDDCSWHPSFKAWSKKLAFVTTMSLLSVIGGWLVPTAIAPLPAHAYVSRIDVTLDVQGGEPYETFLNRAEAVARAAIQRSFNRDILATEVYAIVIGQRQGATVQVLSVQVSRNQWRSRPDTRKWATYYPSAKFLLGYGIPARNTPGTSTTTNRPTTTPTVQVIPAPQPLASPPSFSTGTSTPTGTTRTGTPVVPPSPPQPILTPGSIPNNSTTPTNPLSPPNSTPLPPIQLPRR